MAGNGQKGGVLKWVRVGQMSSSQLLIKILVFGDSGAGKTRLASTAPNVCYLLTEPNGMATIRVANPNAVVVQADDANGGLDTVREFLRAARSGELKRQTGCETIAIDSLLELQRMLRDEIMRSKRGGTQGARFTLQDWGILNDKMRSLVRAFRDLPFHVIGITHASAQTNESGDQRWVAPMFQGKALPAEIAGYFSCVGYVYRQVERGEDKTQMKVHQRVMFQGPETMMIKTLPGLEPIEEPDVKRWIANINKAAEENQTNKADS